MTEAIRLEALRALHGDSFILSYSNARNKTSYIIIDGGPPGAWNLSLKERVEALIQKDSTVLVRLCVLTHADEDHIGGLLELFKFREQHKNDITVLETWVNAFPRDVALNEVAAKQISTASVAQGNELLTLIRQQKILVNNVISLTMAKDGLEVSVVAPMAKSLEKLAATWAKKSNTEAILAAYKDNSVFNRSSIVLLIEKGGAKLLMCGDARGDDILEGLEKTGKISKDGILFLDLLKIPHHGGDNNVTPDFFLRLPAKNYLISTDGAKFPHPHPSMLTDLFSARKSAFPNDPFKIQLTYAIDELGEKADVPEIKTVIAKAHADGLDFTVETVTGPLIF